MTDEMRNIVFKIYIFGPQKYEVTEQWTRLHNEKLNNLVVIKCCEGDKLKRMMNRQFMWENMGKIQMWENITIYHRERKDWIQLAQDRACNYTNKNSLKF